MVTLSESQLTALYEKTEPGIKRAKGKEDDREAHGTAVWKQVSKKLDKAGDS